jgi:DNA-binding NarL/FixJ family response regulator
MIGDCISDGRKKRIGSVSQPTTVLLADDHSMLRAGLKVLLETQAGAQVIGEASDGRTAVKLAAQLSPDIVVMDINMPDLNGIEATRQIRANGKGPKVIALTAFAPSHFTTEMLKAGASGYVLKTSAFQELGDALDAVRAGKIYLSPAVANEAMTNDGSNGHASQNVFSRLSGREREVLQLLAEGKSTKEVANHLDVSVKTAETHRRNLMEKLGLHSIAELTKYAIREGITSTQY